jgi:hypothetical protein
LQAGEKNTNQQKWLKLRSQNQKQFKEYLQKEIRRPQIHGTTIVFLGKKENQICPITNGPQLKFITPIVVKKNK